MKIIAIAGLRGVKLERQLPTRRKVIDFLKPEKLEAPNTTEVWMRYQA